MTGVLCATDLDRTMIYSRAALALGGEQVLPELVCVEHYRGREASFMTCLAAARYAALAARVTVLPVTTRLPDQLARVRLPGPPARFAVAANGGVLLVDGVADADWAAAVRRRLSGATPLAEVWAHLQRHCRPAWTKSLRDAGGLFCYAVVQRSELPGDAVAELTSWAAERGWQTSLQGGKLYWLPESLTKSAAVAEVARRSGCDRVLAAGDSLLDRDLLLGADLGIHPRHGELADTGWTAGHVVCTDVAGVRAAEQILQWFADTGLPPASGQQQGGVLQRPLDDQPGGAADGGVRAEGRPA